MDAARSVHTNLAGVGTDALFPHPPLDAETHNILPLEGYKGDALSMGIMSITVIGTEVYLHTTRNNA